MRLKLVLLMSVMLFSLAPLSAEPVASDSLRVGVARIEITPSDMSLNQMGKDPYLGVHDPIYARALVLANSSETAAIVSLDIVDFPFDLKPLQDRIQQEVGIPSDHVIITATHDHSAPHFARGAPACHADGPPGGACSEAAQMDAFTKTTSDRVVKVLQEAKAALQPARMGLGTGSVDVNVSRDLYGPRGWGMGSNPAGPSDKTVWVVKFESPQGAPIAILFNYGVHSTVTMDGQMVSGDLAGTAERDIEQRYGGNFVALFTLAAAGDQNPKFPEFPPAAWQRSMAKADVQKMVFSAMDAQGYMLGAEVLRVAEQIKPTIADPHISAAQSTFTCPAKKPSDGINGEVPIHLSLLKIDQIAFVGVSGEVVTNIQTHLKKASPLTDTILFTIANGRAGYLVDDASYDASTFEVHASPSPRGCVENGIVNGLVKLIQ